MTSRSPASAAEGARRALEALPTMLLPSGLFCREVVEGDGRPRGESVRYTAIVLLGLLAARERGVRLPLNPGALREAVHGSLRRPEVTPGDVGLALWVESRAEAGEADDLVRRLESSLRARGGLGACEGLELAWIVTGLALIGDRAAGGRAGTLLREALDQLIEGNQAPSGLFRQRGSDGPRRRYPNFATEIYSVLALAVAGRSGGGDRALVSARRAADVLLALQLPDGGWPWLYDAERAGVVERYEIYSVHQHGMAPMALLELSEAIGDGRYAEAAERGLGWLFGANELAAAMLPLETGMSYRSIRRRRPAGRLALYASVAGSALAGRPLGRPARAPELNRTCRPYELGWLVEAWAGKEWAHAGD